MKKWKQNKIARSHRYGAIDLFNAPLSTLNLKYTGQILLNFAQPMFDGTSSVWILSKSPVGEPNHFLKNYGTFK